MRLALALGFSLVCLALSPGRLLSAFPWDSDELRVSAEFVSGKVRTSSRYIGGFGTARVKVRVTNESSRYATKVTVAMYFTGLRITFGRPDPKDWRYRTARLSPALAPGESRILSFTERNAYENISVHLARAEFALGVRVNGKPVTTSAEPVIRGGRSYLAISDVARALGADVRWQPATRSVEVASTDSTILLAAGQPVARVNGNAIALDAAPFIRDGRIMMPLRFICTQLGATVHFDKDSNLLQVTSGVRKPPAQAAGEIPEMTSG